MRIIYLTSLLLCGFLFLSVAEEANAQAYSNRVRPQQARTGVSVPSSPAARGGSYRRPISKPFKHVQKQPTVSPYLNLTRADAGVGNYQTLVRPQLEQIQFNRQQQVQLDRLGKEFQNFEARNAYPASGSQDIRATGHTTRYLNLSHYYPQAAR